MLATKRLFSSTSAVSHFSFGSANRVILVGNVGNVDIKEYGDDKKLANFSLATNERYKNKDGEVTVNTYWHRIKTFEPGLVQMAEKFITKGTRVYVEGTLQYREYEQDGVKKTATEIIINRDGLISVLDSRKQE